ncbi:DUF4186 domain-containing protein [Serratia entomophila]|uniref:DUF4186 domain-containing protein n=1 Tax=Serratia entomophila TaxID=42906 RepID=UPI0021792C6D|nr:DUF4186 domain-containing protein [Serratia entomophila]CAI1126242.1 Uncharacterised protein [Serratia entomophila]CAI1854232.1 Uncharacterised protein [Serratia entomophila]CAI1858591.1 Uncharacterised protein [Serratia entomophila]CAI1920075.1 Uncharacterised protein [Serratia entomophila]CAI1950826.1 Uncharacterised protein [Serratia entomophila]
MIFNPDRLWLRLQSSPFRAKFRLNPKDRLYLESKGLPLILSHARDFIESRLADAQPKNDGKQTPMRGHPVFVAQHATATCCRGCLAKWHDIAQGQPLSEEQKRYIVQVIALWLVRRGGAQSDDYANIFDPDRGL